MQTLGHSSPYSDSPRRDLLEFVPSGAFNVLDVGCHTGQFGHALKSATGATVWGVEPNPETSRIAERYLDKVLNHPFIEGLDLPDGHFDAICFNDVLEHMVEPSSALRLAKKKLAPAGKVVIVLPNFRHIDNLVHVVFDKDFMYEDAGIRDRTHLRFYTMKSAPRLLDGTGLKLVEIKGHYEDWWSRSLLRRTAFKLFPGFLNDTKHVHLVLIAEHI
jgi:SAM-dependent methyltransferase